MFWRSLLVHAVVNCSRFIILVAVVIGLTTCSRSPERPIREGRFRKAPVFIISIDTLRADRLPAYGYAAGRTPALDEFRRDAILFRRAYSHVPLTLPSHASLLTGLLPAEHGVRDNVGYRLDPRHASLPAALRQSGYATGAAVSSYVLRRETGMANAFDFYDDAFPFQPGVVLGAIERKGSDTVARAKNWIESQGDRPIFFLLHLFEPHAPYAGGSYDADVTAADAALGQFLNSLKAIKLYDDALIVVLSDHGEGLGDHGEAEHGIFVYREAIHVPLLIKLPGRARANTTVDELAALQDVYPTITSLVGAPQNPALAGRLLTALPKDRHSVFSESMYARLHLGWSDVRSLITDQHHFIEAPRPELFDVVRDPMERRNLLPEERRVYAAFRTEMSKFHRNLAAPTSVNAEEMAKLAALGYLTSSAVAKGNLPDAKDHLADLERLRVAEEQIRRRDHASAVPTLRSLLETNPEFTDARRSLAGVLESLGRWNEAAAEYRVLLGKHPELTEQVALALGVVFLNAGKLDEARAHAELAAKHDPVAAGLLLGRVALAAGNLDAAEAQARQHRKDPHHRGQATLLLAETLRKRGPSFLQAALAELDDARSALGRGEIVPLRGLEFTRADILMRLGRVAEAETAFREEIRMFPHNRDAYVHLGAVYLLQRRPADAESVFQELVNANPEPSSYALAAETFDQFGQSRLAGRWRQLGSRRPKGTA